MFPGRYIEIFGRGARLGCILNLGHSFDAIAAYLFNLLVSRYASLLSRVQSPPITWGDSVWGQGRACGQAGPAARRPCG